MFLAVACFLFCSRTSASALADSDSNACEGGQCSTVLESSAARLAKLINDGDPVDVRSIMSAAELEAALGELKPTVHGWNERIGSFLDLLEETAPIRVNENEEKMKEQHFDSPVLVKRDQGGISAKYGSNLQASEILSHDIIVRPSLSAGLALNYGVRPKLSTGEWNHAELAGMQECSNCTMSLQQFVQQAMSAKRPLRLETSTVDDANIMLQSNGIRWNQLSWLSTLVQTEGGVWKHRHIDHFYNACKHSSAPRMGAAGSLRGLGFHAHQATSNEPIMGRKLFIMFPPRAKPEIGPDISCPWPPWDKPQITDIDDVLNSFFFNTTRHDVGALPGLAPLSPRPCVDQSLTPLQWLVYELPKLPKAYRPLLFVVRPGWALWIPDAWKHMTVNIDDTFWIYHTSCMENNEVPRVSSARARAAIKRICKRKHRFCNGYCHGFCKACSDRQCDCGL